MRHQKLAWLHSETSNQELNMASQEPKPLPRKLQPGEVVVYAPGSDEPVIKTMANGRDLVNGAGYSWTPNDPNATPAANSPYRGVTSDKPGVEEILKGQGVQRPQPGQPADDAQDEAGDGDDEGEGEDEGQADGAEAGEGEGDEGQAEQKPSPRSRRTGGRKRS